MSAINFGEIQNLGKALGMLDGSASFRSDWLSNPGHYLSSVMADQTQRDSLVQFVDDILGAGSTETDASGLVWLPLVSNPSPHVTVYIVLDPTHGSYVGIGVGAELITASPESTTRLHVPVFRAAKTGQTVANPILIGNSADAVIVLDTQITVGTAPPLRGFGLSLRIPTQSGTPEFGLTLSGLQLPGAAQPRDLNLSLSNLAELEASALQLVLGLIRSAAGSAGVPQLSALVALLGLNAGGAIPPLPLDQLEAQGVRALGTWFESVMSNASARTAWLGHLSTLVGGAVTANEITFALGPAQIAIGVGVTTGNGGHSIVTPTITAGITQGDFRVRAEADLFALDLSNFSATALPQLSLYAQLGLRPDGGTRLLSGDPQVDCLRVGMSLDQARRPNFVLAADGVVIAGHPYATLDLLSPNALAQIGGTILGDVINSLLAGLGPIGTAISQLFGVVAPPSALTATTINVATFLDDPLGAVRDYWHGLLRDHPSGVVDLLGTLRDLISDASQGAVAISGSGTDVDPWRLPIVGPVGLDVWKSAASDQLDLAVSAQYIADNLGQRCTRIESRLAVGLMHFDVVNGNAAFLTSVDFQLSARARGSAQATFTAGPLLLTADRIGITGSWRPAGGVSVNILAPNLIVTANGESFPITLPTLAADGTLVLNAAGWDSLETLIGLLASVAPVPWIGELSQALGWSGVTSGPHPHLRLADLAANPAPALKAWLIALAIDNQGTITDALEALARTLTGSGGAFGQLDGSGSTQDPYRLALLPVDKSPELVAWLLPQGPQQAGTQAPDILQTWQPGWPGLTAAQLADALTAEAAMPGDISDLVSGRPDLASGLDTLAQRWTGGDGRIVPPASDPAGVTVHRIDNLAASQLAETLDLTSLLGAAPATTIYIAVAASSAASPWPNAPAGRLLDLRAAGLAPETFTLPAAAAGEWFIALAQRADAKLATGDTDGVAGQAARLSRVLTPFSTVAGSTVLVAQDAAGNPALAAANTLSFVSAVAMLGTPLTQVAFTVLDEEPAADAYRLLRMLLPAVDPQETDDEDLARARGLIGALDALLPFGDPGQEIRPPAVPTPPRAGLAVHAMFGVVDQNAVARSMTAVAAAALSQRAMARAAQPYTDPTGARCGLRFAIPAGNAGLTVSGSGTIELFGADQTGAGPVVSTARALNLHLELRRVNGWLVGGPGIGLGSGLRPQQELRWLECNLSLPFGGNAAASAEIILHEPNIFEIVRERWIVQPSGSPVTGTDVATPALPEVRVLISLVAEQLNSAAGTSPQVDALLSLLQGFGIMAASAGSVPDAIDHLLHDPAARISGALADTTALASITTAINQLLTGVPGLTVDLAGRRVVLDTSGAPGDLGMMSWTAHVEATAAGSVSAQVSMGSAGTTAAGGAVLRMQTGPFSVTLEWHRPGQTTPELIKLWPSPDFTALARALVSLLPAECVRIGLEYLRRLDASAQVVIDAGLDAVGLLGAAVAGQRSVLLPAGLLHDPIGWFQHDSAFGAGGHFSAPRVAALLDAVKPIIGVTGNPGQWNLATGVTAIADADSGNLRLGLHLDTSGLAPVATAAGRLTAGGTFTLTLPPGLAPKPAVLLSAGLSTAAPGRQALYIQLGDHLQMYLRPETGTDISLYPNPAGLGQLASSAVTHALPYLLDQLAGQTGNNLQGHAGEIVRTVGDGLNLRSDTPAHFDSTKLQAWITDPTASLVAALPTLTGTALQAIANALGPVLTPLSVTASVTAGKLAVTAGSLGVTWQPSPFQFGCTATVTGIASLERSDISITLDQTGLQSLSATLGPASITAGDVTLRPFVSAVAGASPAGGRRIEIGLAADGTGTKRVGGRWNLDGSGLSLIAVDGVTEQTDPAHVATALLQAVLDLVASFAIGQATVQQLLGNHIGSTTVREALRGVVLQNVPSPTHLDANLFDETLLLGRIKTLAGNLAGANPSIAVGGGLTVGLSKAGNQVQATLGINGRVPLNTGDTIVSIEADSRWIDGQPPAGLAIGFLDTSTMAFAPSLAVDGIGIRISKSSGPLLDEVLSLGSVALHLYGAVDAAGTLSGGVQVQLSNLAVAVSNAQGGNSVARGLMGDGDSGQNKLAPAFSPALAVQKHGSGPVELSLSAGDGNGPWYLVIQKGFGPIYIEQVGLGVTVQQNQLQKIAILLDGRVSLFGLTASVDDLQLTFVVASTASPFDPSRWAIDLAGLAVNADLAGLEISGGLLKLGDGDNVQYLGMLLGRFAVYGLSIYGGYGSTIENGQRFSSFFAFGAVNGPIGGPPAFFVTGIGGGLGINRDLIFPTDLSQFGQFPFIKALDPSAQPSSDPLTALTQLGTYFPPKRGDFWFAAGISFNSFALVDGIAVISVKIGDGLEIALLGLARMALPRPEFALVSIELGLIARFSSSEGVLWIQAQLTDNSWLLYPDVRLTGGFAFVTWYKGPNAGQFVLTLGGYHPSFHHDGYPMVPRLGFSWSVSGYIVIKGENYFALTSEALMAGGKLMASAHFGPAWAEVLFGADGIVYFDPFRFEISVYARISAGVTIDLWLGEITISISLGASITLAGPKFHGVAEFDVGPIHLSVAFGDSNQSQKIYIPWAQFVTKYLEEASAGVARVLSAVPGKGALPPGTAANGAPPSGTADGSAEKPFEVYSEFQLTVTTTVPTQIVNIGGNDTNYPPSSAIGVSPVGVAAANTRLILTLKDSGGTDQLSKLTATIDQGGGFPIGVWGPPQPDDDRKVPAGNVISAVDSVLFQATATLSGTLPGQVKYSQVEPLTRKPLPFVSIEASRAAFLTAAQGLTALLPSAPGGPATYAAAKPWLKKGGTSNTAVAALERERAAPPLLGSLSQGLATVEGTTPKVSFPTPIVAPPVDHQVHPPRAIAVLTASSVAEAPVVRTTVSNSPSIARAAAPTVDAVHAQFPLAVAAKLVRVAAPAVSQQTTLVANGSVPLTRVARGSVAAVAARGASSDAHGRLNSITSALAPVAGAAAEATQDPTVQEIRAGEVAVLQLPNAIRDVLPNLPRPRLVASGSARLVAFTHGGDVLLDAMGSTDGTVIPKGTERIVVLALGNGSAVVDGLSGWHSALEVAYPGWQSALASGAVMRAEGSTVKTTAQRFRAGWIHAAELVTGTALVVTRFSQPVQTVAIFIDEAVNTGGLKGLSLGLDGADRAKDKNGQAVPLLVIVAANRSVLIYSIVPMMSAAGVPLGAVTVSVASEAGWHLAGVMGGNETPDVMSQRITQNGVDALLRPLVSGRGPSVQLKWITPPPPPVPRPPVPLPLPHPPPVVRPTLPTSPLAPAERDQ
jgi:hypothetical protein